MTVSNFPHHTEYDAALRRMVVRPELSRILSEYDSKWSNKENHENQYHEQIPSIQKSFQKAVVHFANVMEDIGSPFQE